MKYPQLPIRQQKEIRIDRFLGLDRSVGAPDGSFADLRDLTGDGYPALRVQPASALAVSVDGNPADRVLAMADRGVPVLVCADGSIRCGGHILRRLLPHTIRLTLSCPGQPAPTLVDRDAVLSALADVDDGYYYFVFERFWDRRDRRAVPHLFHPRRPPADPRLDAVSLSPAVRSAGRAHDVCIRQLQGIFADGAADGLRRAPPGGLRHRHGGPRLRRVALHVHGAAHQAPGPGPGGVPPGPQPLGRPSGIAASTGDPKAAPSEGRCGHRPLRVYRTRTEQGRCGHRPLRVYRTRSCVTCHLSLAPVPCCLYPPAG